jgi:hypothetical protein
MRHAIILLIFGTVLFCNSGCREIQSTNTPVAVRIANASIHNLNGVKVECSGRYLSAGILIPGTGKTTFDVPWPNSSTMKIIFFHSHPIRDDFCFRVLIFKGKMVASGGVRF